MGDLGNVKTGINGDASEWPSTGENSKKQASGIN